jgi:hypothetical protein
MGCVLLLAIQKSRTALNLSENGHSDTQQWCFLKQSQKCQSFLTLVLDGYIPFFADIAFCIQNFNFRKPLQLIKIPTSIIV